MLRQPGKKVPAAPSVAYQSNQGLSPRNSSLWIMQTDGSHPSFSGVVEETFGAEEHVYASPGSDVNLTCQTQKKGILVQMQWSKVTDKVDLLAVYHPQHGFYCDSKSACRSLVAFREPPGNVFEWTLFLRNVSSSTTGKYECSFTLYPEGIQTKIYSLKIQTNGKYDCKWEGSMCWKHSAFNKYLFWASRVPGTVPKYRKIEWKEVLPGNEDRNWSNNAMNKC